MPSNRINSIFPNIYKDMPLPNQVSPTDPLNLSGNYGTSGLLRLNRNQYDTKINYNVSQKLAVWGKYSRMDSPVEGKYPFGSLGGAALGTAGKGETTTQLATGGLKHSPSPAFLFFRGLGLTPLDQLLRIPHGR